MKPIASKWTRILEAVLIVATAWLLAPEPLHAQVPPIPPPAPSACDRFNLATGWKGTFTIVGSGSGTFPDGGSYSINESISATPDLSTAGVGPGEWTGALNETIHIDDIETHPDPTAPNGVRFTHITDDETIPRGPVFALAGLPGGALQLDLANCKFFEFDFDPSNNAITTTELGVLFSQGEVFFLGGQQGGITYAPGAITAPLPASGLALSTSVSFSALGSGLSELSTWTITLSLQPVLDFDLVVTIPQYSDWRPTAGMTESDTGIDGSGKPNLLEIQALLINKSTGQPASFIPDKMTFQLPDASTEPGVAMNWPSKDQLASNPPPDLNFDKNVPENTNFSIPGNGTQASITPLFPSTLGPVRIMLSPHDWGGWATLNVTATIADQTIQGHFQSDTNTNILLPKRQSKSQHVADVWKDQQGVPLSTPDNDDSETNPDGLPGCVGDGLTLYEEYRGFMENGKHIEGDPNKKDFFIQNLIGADAEPGIASFTALTQLKVHKDIQKNEMAGVNAAGQLGDRLINFNHASGAHVTDQHGVILATCSPQGGLTSVFRDGGKTFLNQPGVRGRPGLTNGICMQGRDLPGRALSADNLHRSGFAHSGVITASDALRQYDVGVAHELLHSVGVEHHGDVDPEGEAFAFLPPNNPLNTTGQPVFQLQGQYVRLLHEEGGPDVATTLWAAIQAGFAKCQTIVANPAQNDPVVVEYCQDNLSKPNDSQLFGLYLAKPHGEHSGNDLCVMRYFFANAYPSLEPSVGFPLYYLVTAGTEPVGSILDDSPAGTGINADTHSPQPRYFDAADRRGDCKHWVCVNDKYAPVPK